MISGPDILNDMLGDLYHETKKSKKLVTSEDSGGVDHAKKFSFQEYPVPYSHYDSPNPYLFIFYALR